MRLLLLALCLSLGLISPAQATLTDAQRAAVISVLTNFLLEPNETGTSGTPTSVPDNPSTLVATAMSSTQINLTWFDASAIESGFKLERKTGSGGTYAQIATPAANAASYMDLGLTAGTTYYYRVRATNSIGDSLYSNEASATTMPSASGAGGSAADGGLVNATTGTVTYTYDVFGNLVQTNAGGVVTTLTYDLRGRKTAMADPDMGSWTYAYNALGELIRQVDAKSQTTTMTYDLLGRMTVRTEPDLTSTWTYDSCTKGVGKLCTAATDNSYTRSHTYDSLGRPSTVSVTVDTAHVVTTSYDSAGRVETLTYPTGFVTKNVYNSYGYLEKVQDTASTPLVFWQATAQNAAGQVTAETLGNGLTASRTYDALFRLTAVSATDGSATPHSQSFAYDAIGNLSTRTDVHQSVTENFAYDTLNRLTFLSGSAIATRSFIYDAIGNMKYKSDVGIYTYPSVTSARPHAVTSVSGGGLPYSVTASYGYDANGNLTSVSSGTLYPASGSVSFSRTLTYMASNMPSVLTHVQGGSTYSYTYTYNAEHERVRLVTVRPSDTLTSIYVHPAGKGALLYEKETRASDGRVEHKHYVNGGAGLVGVYVTKSSYDSGEGPEMRYYHKDHLGSIAVLTNPAGAVIERLAYEAFGERRSPGGNAEDRSSPIVGVKTDRGFTGHEHLDEMMLVHMNGRIYDPVLGRFMTADPVLQAPENLQNYNRYSYVLNNPLAYTDPTGYKFKLGNLFKVAAVAAAAYFTAGAISGALIESATAGFIGGANGLTTALVTLGGEAGTLTALGTGMSWAGGGFVGGFLSSGGDLSIAVKSGVAVGLTAGFGQVGMEWAGAPGSIAGKSLASGASTQAFGGSFADGLKNGLMGAIRGEAFAYMQTETDKLATAWWKERMQYDEFGRPWTYGNRDCIGGSGGSACRTWFPFLMPTENLSASSPMFSVFGPAPGSVPVLGTFLNSVSKVHDWLNQTLTGVYDTKIGSPTYGGARDFGVLANTLIDTVSTAGMLPAAAFTARSIYNNPLRFTQGR